MILKLFPSVEAQNLPFHLNESPVAATKKTLWLKTIVLHFFKLESLAVTNQAKLEFSI